MDALGWQRFHLTGQGKSLTVGFIAPKYMTGPESSFDHLVFFGHSVMLKCMDKHDMTVRDLTIVDDVLAKGMIVKERRKLSTTTIFGFSDPLDRWFCLVLKKCATRPDVYVSTFFKLRKAEVRRRANKGQILRPHVDDLFPHPQ